MLRLFILITLINDFEENSNKRDVKVVDNYTHRRMITHIIT